MTAGLKSRYFCSTEFNECCFFYSAVDSFQLNGVDAAQRLRLASGTQIKSKTHPKPRPNQQRMYDESIATIMVELVVMIGVMMIESTGCSNWFILSMKDPGMDSS